MMLRLMLTSKGVAGVLRNCVASAVITKWEGFELKGMGPEVGVTAGA